MARLDHLNARVGARRSRLIGPGGLRELLVRPTLAARIELLVRSGRLAVAPAAGVPAQLAEVEVALRDGLRRDEARLLRETEGMGARRLLRAALGLQEGQAIKVLLRGTAHGAPPDRLAATAPPTAELPGRRLRELAASPSPEVLAERLAASGSPFAPPLRAALTQRARVGLLPAEVAIDRVAFGRVAAAARRGGEDGAQLRGWLAERADARNAITLLALGGAPAARELHVPGGRRIDAAAFERLGRADPGARRAAVAAIVPCEPGRLAEPAAAERLLEGAVARRLRLAARRSPLSLAVPLAWIEARREEVHRIALVLRGAALGLAGDSILDLVEA